MFGQGLADDQNLSAQYARANDFKVRTVNFSAPGYGPNQFVRALEAGLLDHLAGGGVKAVVTWIIPDHLARVSGDSGWLGAAPRYVLGTDSAEAFNFVAHSSRPVRASNARKRLSSAAPMKIRPEAVAIDPP